MKQSFVRWAGIFAENGRCYAPKLPRWVAIPMFSGLIQRANIMQRFCAAILTAFLTSAALAADGQPSQQILTPSPEGVWTLTGQLSKPVHETVQMTVVAKVPVSVQKEIDVNGKKETRVYTEYVDEFKTVTKQVSKLVCVLDCRPVERATIKAFETNGKAISPADLAKRVKGETLVVVSDTEGMIPEYYASVFKPGTIVLALPRPPMNPPMMAPVPFKAGAPLPAPVEAVPTPKPQADAGTEPTIRAVSFQPPAASAPAAPTGPKLPNSPAPVLVFASREDANGYKLRQLAEVIQETTLKVMQGNKEIEVKAPRTTRHSDTVRVDGELLKFRTAAGQEQTAERVKERLSQGEKTVVYSQDGKAIDPFWLQNLKESVLVVTGPVLTPTWSPMSPYGHGPMNYPMPMPAAAPAPFPAPQPPAPPATAP
jgi:hypothetical protein